MRRTAFPRLLRLVVLLLLALGTIFVVVQAGRTWHHLASAEATLRRFEERLTVGQESLVRLLGDPEQFAVLRSDLTRLDRDLRAIESISRPILPFCPHLGWLPYIGGDVSALPHLLDLGRQTSSAALALFDGLSPFPSRMAATETGIGELGPALVQVLVEAQPKITEAQCSIAQAKAARNTIDASLLGAGLRSSISDFDRYQPQLETGLQILAVLPAVLGADSARTYLLLAQNSHELRATGGFISGVGRVQVQAGNIENLFFQDSYTVDDLAQPHSLAPAILRREMGTEILLLRDANWWPDFPTSARIVADIYLQDQGVPVDGVIAVDLVTLRLLVEALGPLQIPGYDRVVTGGNLQSMIMTFWQAPRSVPPGKDATDWWAHRKDFASDLMSALLVKALEDADTDALVKLAQNVGAALQQKHLLIYLDDPQSQPLLQKLHWDGSLRASEGDFLMIVDSNTGFNKVNPNIEQALDFEITIDGSGTAIARLSLTYRHLVQRPTPACVHESRYGDSYADLMDRCYWDHLRVYLPDGSTLVEMRGSDAPAEVYQESGRTVVSTAFLLETGQARQIELTYRPNIPQANQHYSLLIQKQPGTDMLPYRVRVGLPVGARPVGSQPSAAWVDGLVVWQGASSQDLELALSWDGEQ